MKLYSMIKVNYGHSLTLMLINNSNVKHDRIKEDIAFLHFNQLESSGYVHLSYRASSFLTNR